MNFKLLYGSIWFVSITPKVWTTSETISAQCLFRESKKHGSVNSGAQSFATHRSTCLPVCASVPKSSVCHWRKVCALRSPFPMFLLIWEKLLLPAMCQLPIRPKRCHDTNLVMDWLLVGLHVVENPPSLPKPCCVCHKESVQSRTWTKSWTAFMVIGCDKMKINLSHPRGFLKHQHFGFPRLYNVQGDPDDRNKALSVHSHRA